jgi:DNA primase
MMFTEKNVIAVCTYKGVDVSMEKERLYELNKFAANTYYQFLLHSGDKAGITYFKQRELMPETVKKYGLGYAPDDWDFMTKTLLKAGFSKEEILASGLGVQSKKNPDRMYDFFRSRVMFPIVDLKGDVIGFGGRALDDSTPKYLNSGDTPVFDKGKNLFSLNHAKKSDAEALILCEGYMDVITMNQAGFTEAIATLGTAITPDQARLISMYTDKVICAYDNDEAGFKAKKKAVELLSEQGVEVWVLNTRGVKEKDPDEFIKVHGADAFRNLLGARSESAVEWILRTGQETLDLNTEEGKWELADRLVKPLAMLSDAERNLYLTILEQKYDITFSMTKEQAFSELSVIDADRPVPHLYDLDPSTFIGECGLPENIVNELGQGGITTVGELLDLSASDMKLFFDDAETIKELCELTGTKPDASHDKSDE